MPKSALMMPLAMSMSLPSNSWFSINALSDDTAEVVIYDEIGGWGITAKQFSEQLVSVADGKSRILLKLHSPGGDVFEGLAIYNMLRGHPATVEVEIAGLAASMGSVIAMAGDVVRIPENAWMMIHNPWGVQGGDAEAMREYADLLDKVSGSMINAYAAKCGKTADEIRQMMAKTTWMDGNDAVANGFADEVLQPLEAAASLNSQRLQEFDDMPEALKTILAPQGNTPAPAVPKAPAGDNTPAGQTNPPAPQPQTPSPAPAGTTDFSASFRQEEQDRRDQIRALFSDTNGRFDDLQNDCLLDMNCSFTDANAKLMAALKQDTAQPIGGVIQFGRASTDFRGDMTSAILVRGGVNKPKEGEQGNNHFRGMHLMELARACLQQVGVNSYGMDKMEMIGMAFTHGGSDFGQILLDVAHKSLLAGYGSANETFQRWTRKGTLTDFKIANRVGLESFPELDMVPAGGEYKYATLNDTGEKIQLAKFGKKFSITREDIINDDLHAFTEIPKLMGQAAIRTIGNLVYAVLANNPAMGDGKTLFHADHGNLLTAAALGMDSLDAARTAMAVQEDSAGQVLNIMPSHLIVPVALQGRANQLMRDQTNPDGSNSKASNTVQGMAEVVADARLDKAFKGGALPWFITAGNGMEPVEVSYLDGNDVPYIEQKAGWDVDGVETKVRIDAGVKAVSYRTIVKNPGKA